MISHKYLVRMYIETALKNKTINNISIYCIISKLTGFGNNRTPKVLFIVKWSSACRVAFNKFKMFYVFFLSIN